VCILLSIIGIICSQNAAFLVVPIGCFLLLNQYKKLSFYLLNLLGLIAALPLQVYIYWFYKTHPLLDMHKLQFDFGFDIFLETLKHTDKYFNFLTPFPAYKLITVLLFYIFFATICFIFRKPKEGLSIITGMIFLLFSLSFSKTQNASESIFFSGVRMFLGVPISFIIFGYWAENSFSSLANYQKLREIAMKIFLAVGIFYFIDRNIIFRPHLYSSCRQPDELVAEWVNDSRMSCEKFYKMCLETNSNLVVVDNWMIEVSYYAAAMNHRFKTLVPSYERRTWAMQSEDTTIRDYFIYLPPGEKDMSQNIPKYINIAKINEDPAAYLIKTNGHKVFEILKEMHVRISEH